MIAQPVAHSDMNISSDASDLPVSSDADRLVNRLHALYSAIARARSAETVIEAREAIEEAHNLLEPLCDPLITCRCGYPLDQRGHCAACIEQQEQLDADFRRISAKAHDIDPLCGF